MVLKCMMLGCGCVVEGVVGGEVSHGAGEFEENFLGETFGEVTTEFRGGAHFIC